MHQGETVVSLASPEDVPQIATLHGEGLRDAFLTSLGSRFLARLYRTLVHSSSGVVLTARDGPSVIGFAASTLAPAAFWKEFVRKEAVRTGVLIAGRLVRPGVAKGVLDVVRHLKRDGTSGAELLSIMVGPPSRRTGLGSRLVMQMEEALRERGSQVLSVPVRIDNRMARAFFERLGFHPLGQLEIHQGDPSLRYVKQL
jgi:ribosomal protein S18 acetylase RimI-like enzyme